MDVWCIFLISYFIYFIRAGFYHLREMKLQQGGINDIEKIALNESVLPGAGNWIEGIKPN